MLEMVKKRGRQERPLQRKDGLNTIARTAPIGWNSWNTFGPNINEELIRQMADVMVEKGYRDAGYEYLVIDDCWSPDASAARTALLTCPNPEKFPHGMKAVGRLCAQPRG